METSWSSRNLWFSAEWKQAEVPVTFGFSAEWKLVEVPVTFGFSAEWKLFEDTSTVLKMNQRWSSVDLAADTKRATVLKKRLTKSYMCMCLYMYYVK